MAITFVAAGANGDNGSVGSGNPTAPGIPAGMAAGDYMLLVCHSTDNVTISTPSGWTLKQAQNAGTVLRQTIFWRRWQSGDAAPTIAHTAGDACQARIYGFRGVSTTAADPIEAIATQTGTASATVTAASITTVSDNVAVVGAWAEEVTGNTSGAPTWASYSGTNPTFAEIGDNGVDNLNANELGVGVAWGTCTPAGTSTGTRTAVVSGAAATPTNNIGTLLALTADVPAGGSRQSVMLPLTGLAIPGQPAVAPPLGPASGSEPSAFDIISPLPATRFVNPLSLVLGAQLFPAPQPYVQAITGPITYDKTGSLFAGAVLSGSDVFEASETGSVLAGAIQSGADAFTASETGSLLASGILSGADVFSPAETGSLLAGSVLSGADVFQASETGSLLAGSIISGADTFTASDTGSVLAGSVISGADVFSPSETGSVLAGSIISGTAVRVGTIKAGSILTGSLLSGADATTFAETGRVLAGSVQAGGDAFTAIETGSLLGSSYLAGSAARTSEGVLTLSFGPPHPHGGSGQGSPAGGEGVGSPAGGVGLGDPSGSFYGKPSPRQVRT